MGREVKVDAEAAASPVRFALVKAVEGGTSGAMAMAIQVGLPRLYNRDKGIKPG